MIVQIGGTFKLKKNSHSWTIQTNNDGANEFIYGIFLITDFTDEKNIPKKWDIPRVKDQQQITDEWLKHMGLWEVYNNTDNHYNQDGNLHDNAKILNRRVVNILDNAYAYVSEREYRGNPSEVLGNGLFGLANPKDKTAQNAGDKISALVKTSATNGKYDNEYTATKTILQTSMMNSRKASNQYYAQVHGNVDRGHASAESSATRIQQDSQQKENERQKYEADTKLGPTLSSANPTPTSQKQSIRKKKTNNQTPFGMTTIEMLQHIKKTDSVRNNQQTKQNEQTEQTDTVTLSEPSKENNEKAINAASITTQILELRGKIQNLQISIKDLDYGGTKSGVDKFKKKKINKIKKDITKVETEIIKLEEKRKVEHNKMGTMGSKSTRKKRKRKRRQTKKPKKKQKGRQTKKPKKKSKSGKKTRKK